MKRAEFEIRRLYGEVLQRDAEIARLSREVASRDRRVAQLEGELGERPTAQPVATVRGRRGGLRRGAAKRFYRRWLGMPSHHPLKRLYRRLPARLRFAAAKPLVARLRHRAESALVENSGLFDPDFYLQQNPEAVGSGMDPLSHFLLRGAAEGRDPHPGFDASHYLEANPDVAADGINPLVHYLLYGAAAGRAPLASLDSPPGWEPDPELEEGDALLLGGPRRAATACAPGAGSPEARVEAVCIVTPDLVGPVKNGGIGTACLHFARSLAQAEYPVTILFTGPGADRKLTARWRRAYRQLGIDFFTLCDAPRLLKPVHSFTRFLETSWRVYEFLRVRRFRHVHFQDWQANGFWPIRAKRVGEAFEDTTLAVTLHSPTEWIDEGMGQDGADPLMASRLAWYERFALRYADAVLSPSQYMLDWAAKRGVALGDRHAVIPYNLIREDRPEPKIRAARFDPDHLIFFGRLETRKGLHVFGEALRLLAAAPEPVCPRRVSLLGKHALVNGEPSQRYLARLQRALPDITFAIHSDLDARQALDYITAGGGIAVMPSLVDNYPLTVVECIQHGIPFVASTAGGIPEMADPAVLFEPRAPALAQRLAARRQIAFDRLQHRYAAERARAAWLAFHTEPPPARWLTGSAEPRPSSRLSVCIPYYNHPRELRRLLEALSEQTVGDFELVAVNDGSAPAAREVFDACAAQYAARGYRFLTTENRGPGAARNAAAAAARGDHLLFFDADNVPHRDMVERFLRAATHSGADCVTAGFAAFDAAVAAPAAADIVYLFQPTGGHVEAASMNNLLGDAAFWVKREVFEALGGFAPTRESWEDYEFLLRLCLRGYDLQVIPGPLYFYALSPQSRKHRARYDANRRSAQRLLDKTPRAVLERFVRDVSP